MSNDKWSGLHNIYKTSDWINKPNIFAEEVIKYLPKNGKLLDLGAGQGQDSRFFAEKGYDVISTDISDSALEINKEKSKDFKNIQIQKIDLQKDLPFEQESFDVVYAHLSLHYFDANTTRRIFNEIQRVLKKGGIVAIFTNVVTDPEYASGIEIEKDYFDIDGVKKRFFSAESLGAFSKDFETILLDQKGETYKDAEKGIHGLVRFIGRK